MRGFPIKLTRRHLSLLLAALALAALALAVARWILGPSLPVEQVRRMDLMQTVVASGRVETPLRVDVGSQLTGTVAEVAVAQGQTVRKGQVLLVLEDSEQRSALAVAETGVAQAQARLAQLERMALPAARQNVEQARINLDNAERQYSRNQELRKRNFIGQATLDDTRRNLDIARSQLRAAQLQAQSNAPGGADHGMAMAALQQARANVKAAQARLDMTRITAPHDGVLIVRNVERGDVVTPGKVLLVLSPAGKVQLVLQVDERNLAQLCKGQNAVASADAYPDRRFAASVAYLNPGVDAQRGTVEVRLDVPRPPDYLRQDMTVSVDIEIGRRRQVLTVPADTVHVSQGQTWVMKVSSGRASRQPVTLGLRGTGRIEVVAGLREGESVLAATAPVQEGQRLRPRAAPAGGARQ